MKRNPPRETLGYNLWEEIIEGVPHQVERERHTHTDGRERLKAVREPGKLKCCRKG